MDEKKNIDISISPLASRDQPEQEQANASSSARPDASQKQHDRQQANARTEKPLETLYLWELRDMCKAKGLISTGRKNVLIVRIRAHQKPIDVPDMQLPSVAMVHSIGSIEVPTDVAQHVHSTSPPAPLGVEPLGAADQLSSATATLGASEQSENAIVEPLAQTPLRIAAPKRNAAIPRNAGRRCLPLESILANYTFTAIDQPPSIHSDRIKLRQEIDHLRVFINQLRKNDSRRDPLKSALDSMRALAAQSTSQFGALQVQAAAVDEAAASMETFEERAGAIRAKFRKLADSQERALLATVKLSHDVNELLDQTRMDGQDAVSAALSMLDAADAELQGRLVQVCQKSWSYTKSQQ